VILEDADRHHGAYAIDADDELVELGSYRVPARITAEFQKYGVRLELAFESGRYICNAVARLDGAPPLTGTRLRFPLEDLAKFAFRVAAAKRIAGPENSSLLVNPRGSWATDDALQLQGEAAKKARSPAAPRRGGKRPLADEKLMQAAEIYRGSILTGESAREIIAREFKIEPVTAARWIMESRRRGFLGPAIGRRVGERPVEP